MYQHPVEVRELRFAYRQGTAPAVENLTFAVRRDEIFGFLGPSGAGKSTTQRLLVGLLKNYCGIARVLGREVATWQPECYEQIGVSFETPNHFLKPDRPREPALLRGPLQQGDSSAVTVARCSRPHG